MITRTKNTDCFLAGTEAASSFKSTLTGAELEVLWLFVEVSVAENQGSHYC